MKNSNVKKNINLNSRKIHLPNPMHLKACITGGNVYVDKTVYSRKIKHKNKIDE